jgi:RHS repeat-associated protein
VNLKVITRLTLLVGLSLSAKPQKPLIADFHYTAERGFRGEKLVTTNGTLTKHIAYIYDGNLVSAEVNVLNGHQKLIRKYTWGLDPAGTKQEVGGIGTLVGMESFDETGIESNKYHMVSDAGGNVVQVLLSEDDGTLGLANTYEYGPFGQVIAKVEAVENPMQYQSKMFDTEFDGKLGYWGYRFLDVENGRWLNNDPIGVEGGINTSNYLSNNPVNGFARSIKYTGGMGVFVGEIVRSMGVDAFGDVVGIDLIFDAAILAYDISVGASTPTLAMDFAALIVPGLPNARASKYIADRFKSVSKAELQNIRFFDDQLLIGLIKKDTIKGAKQRIQTSKALNKVPNINKAFKDAQRLSSSKNKRASLELGYTGFRKKSPGADFYRKHFTNKSMEEARKSTLNGKSSLFFPGTTDDDVIKLIEQGMQELKGRKIALKDLDNSYYYHHKTIGWENGKCTQWLRIKVDKGIAHAFPTPAPANKLPDFYKSNNSFNAELNRRFAESYTGNRDSLPIRTITGSN